MTPDMQSNTLEFILFDDSATAAFQDYLQTLSIRSQRSEIDDGIVIAIPDDLDDATDARIEREYDRLLEAQLFAENDDNEFNRVAIQYADRDGNTRQVRMDMAVINRLLQVLNLDELQAFVQQVANEVEAGGAARLCEP